MRERSNFNLGYVSGFENRIKFDFGGIIGGRLDVGGGRVIIT